MLSRRVRATTRPTGSTTPLIPLFAARTSGIPSSTARVRAIAKCWYGPELLPYQASFVTLSSQAGRVGGAARRPGQIAPVQGGAAGEDRLVADRRGKRRQTRQDQGSRPRTGGHIDRPWNEIVDRQQSAERHVLAERHEMRLVVNGADRAGAVDRLDAVPYLHRRLGRRVGPHRTGNDVAALGSGGSDWGAGRGG